MTKQDVFEISLGLFDRTYTDEDYAAAEPPKEIRYCQRYYDMAIAKTLRERNWSFLIKELDIDTGYSEPGYGFAYGYYLPFNLFTVTQVGNNEPYRVVGDMLFTNELTVRRFHGIYKEVDLDAVPEDFVELIACVLAYILAPMLAPAGVMDQPVMQRYTWAFQGLLDAECNNNSRAPDFVAGEDHYG